MGFFPGIFKSILSMYPHSYCLYGVLFCVCVARSGDNIAGCLGARVPTGGKVAVKAVAKAKPVPVVAEAKAAAVGYLAHLRDFFDPLIICACVDLFYQIESSLRSHLLQLPLTTWSPYSVLMTPSSSGPKCPQRQFKLAPKQIGSLLAPRAQLLLVQTRNYCSRC